MSGAKVAGRTVRVEHVTNYKKQKAEVRDKWQGRVGTRKCGQARATRGRRLEAGFIGQKGRGARFEGSTDSRSLART